MSGLNRIISKLILTLSILLVVIVLISCKGDTKQQDRFRTEFIDVSNNQKTTFYHKASKGILGLGHGMCSGAFRYRGSGKYKARFIAVNTDGEVLKRSNWKIFDSPYTIAQRKS